MKRLALSLIAGASFLSGCATEEAAPPQRGHIKSWDEVYNECMADFERVLGPGDPKHAEAEAACSDAADEYRRYQTSDY